MISMSDSRTIREQSVADGPDLPPIIRLKARYDVVPHGSCVNVSAHLWHWRVIPSSLG